MSHLALRVKVVITFFCDNMLDNCYLMNVDMVCLYIDIEINVCFGNYIHVI